MKMNARSSKGRGILNRINNTRRDFLKSLGAVTLGGLSTFALPKPAQARGAAKDLLSSLKARQSAGVTDELYWWFIRSQFLLDPEIIYMNTGTEGSMPRTVLNNLLTYSRRFTQNPYEAIVFDEELMLRQEYNCECVGTMMGATLDELTLTTNTTDGLHLAVHGLDFEAGDEILTTLHEHDALLSPLCVLRDRKGVVLKELALPTPATSKDEIVDIFSNGITDKTKAMCFCHINYTTGLRMPVNELCELASSNGLISIVDGAHSMGMIDFNLHEMGCDFYACPGHKWLNGPPGTGIFYVKDSTNNPHNLWPLLTEGYGIIDWWPIARVLQLRGQENTPALTAMQDAIEFYEAIGKQKVESRILSLSNYLKEKVVENWGEENLLSPRNNDGLSTGLVAFTPYKNPEDKYSRDSASAIYNALKDNYKIYIRSVSYKDKETHENSTTAIRVSTHIFNSFQEIDTLVDALTEITAEL